MDTKNEPKEQHNEQDWSELCQITDGLALEFGGRSAAFQEAVRRAPHLNAAPPGRVDVQRIIERLGLGAESARETASGDNGWGGVLAKLNRR
jgi:hypothetical protein